MFKIKVPYKSLRFPCEILQELEDDSLGDNNKCIFLDRSK